jgi:hypothetical protein
MVTDYKNLCQNDRFVVLLLFSVDHVEYDETNGGSDAHAGNETHGNK